MFQIASATVLASYFTTPPFPPSTSTVSIELHRIAHLSHFRRLEYTIFSASTLSKFSKSFAFKEPRKKLRKKVGTGKMKAGILLGDLAMIKHRMAFIKETRRLET